ncbi:type II CAAX prenyl endopeptidase Rce1 family protein [[Actinomadura] parvosata]|uniref:CPBP family glutamic-type intramembrane protease n=1 Tax=[Actinomadura] parvosata TaxID=1955412 RepID=UPI0012BBDD71|nr:CPBP family glutamic-type intramembrane protease [Nonomuraea sp. ATCC 55076]
MRDPRPAASADRPGALTAAVVIFVALAYPAPLITWWNATGFTVPAVSAVLTLYYVMQVSILAQYLVGWCLPRTAFLVKAAITAASVAVTIAATTAPRLLTYGLFYTASTVMCLVLAVQQLGRAPLWPPRARDVPLTLVPFPLILLSVLAVSALATVLGIPLTGEPSAHASATGLLGTVAHIDTGAEWLIRSAWTGVGEETGVALLVTGLTRRGVRLPAVCAVAAAVRVTYHAQFSLAAVGLGILAVGMVLLWRRYERLLPLIAAHTLWDALAREHPQSLLAATGAGLAIVIGACGRPAVRRLRRKHGRPDPAAAPGTVTP